MIGWSDRGQGRSELSPGQSPAGLGQDGQAGPQPAREQEGSAGPLREVLPYPTIKATNEEKSVNVEVPAWLMSVNNSDTQIQNDYMEKEEKQRGIVEEQHDVDIKERAGQLFFSIDS